MFTFSPVQTNDESLAKYEVLFAACFGVSDKFSPKSLKWLYADNPDGQVIGFDAYAGDELAAHYVCIPSVVMVNGKRVRAALSLNTATHPKFQGKGLFTKLAELTYLDAANAGYSCIYGVANANSTPGFIRKLGFQLVQQLDAKVGFGRLKVDFEKVKQTSAFSRVWSEEALRWRCNNPVNPVSQFQLSNGIGLHAEAFGKKIPVFTEIAMKDFKVATVARPISPLRLYLGLLPQGTCSFSSYFNIPKKFRPSPLNFIFKSLVESKPILEAGKIHFDFIDFDAY